MNTAHNWTPIPNDLFDLASTLSHAEAYILFVILRKTLGDNRLSADLSYADLRRASGIASDATISRALKTLRARGVIATHAAPGTRLTIRLSWFDER